jgi:hypothetical protein
MINSDIRASSVISSSTPRYASTINVLIVCSRHWWGVEPLNQYDIRIGPGACKRMRLYKCAASRYRLAAHARLPLDLLAYEYVDRVREGTSEQLLLVRHLKTVKKRQRQRYDQWSATMQVH